LSPGLLHAASAAVRTPLHCYRVHRGHGSGQGVPRGIQGGIYRVVYTPYPPWEAYTPPYPPWYTPPRETSRPLCAESSSFLGRPRGLSAQSLSFLLRRPRGLSAQSLFLSLRRPRGLSAQRVLLSP